jgi:hypothetical protein
MSIVSLILGLALVGLVLWLVITYIPMPAQYKNALVVVVVVLVVLWLIRLIAPGIVVPTTP